MKALNIQKATLADTEWLDEIIKREFPYTKFTPKKIIERINNPEFLVFVAKQENILVGFGEMQLFLDKKEARLNGIFVEDAWRDQGIAKEIIARIINQCKHKKIQRLFLLVKENNEDAKALYKKTEFVFEKMHDKIIEGEKVEVWGQNV